jgi:inner membrane transporter RhtA
MNHKHNHTQMWASLWVIAAQISVNLGAALGKAVFAQVGPLGVVALRTAISRLLLIAMTRPWRLRVDRAQALWLVLYGLVMGCMNVMFYSAIARIPIGIAVTIEICGPLGVVLATSRSCAMGCGWPWRWRGCCCWRPGPGPWGPGLRGGSTRWA